MLITDFEKEIQKEIDPNLSIRINPNATDIAGVYWNELYIGVSVPPVEIREKLDPNYKDGIGYPYKDRTLAKEFIVGKLAKYKKTMAEDPSLFEDDDKYKNS